MSNGTPMLQYRSFSVNGETPVTAINRNMNVNGAITPVRFKVGPPPGQRWEIHRMILLIVDGGSMDTGGWGNNGGIPLPNGMTAGMEIKGIEINMTPVPWISHADLAGVAYDVRHDNWGQGEEFVCMRLTFTKAGVPIVLVGSAGDHIWIDVNDDLTYITRQSCMVQGNISNLIL